VHPLLELIVERGHLLLVLLGELARLVRARARLRARVRARARVGVSVSVRVRLRVRVGKLACLATHRLVLLYHPYISPHISPISPPISPLYLASRRIVSYCFFS